MEQINSALMNNFQLCKEEIKKVFEIILKEISIDDNNKNNNMI